MSMRVLMVPRPGCPGRGTSLGTGTEDDSPAHDNDSGNDAHHDDESSFLDGGDISDDNSPPSRYGSYKGGYSSDEIKVMQEDCTVKGWLQGVRYGLNLVALILRNNGVDSVEKVKSLAEEDDFFSELPQQYDAMQTLLQSCVEKGLPYNGFPETIEPGMGRAQVYNLELTLSWVTMLYDKLKKKVAGGRGTLGETSIPPVTGPSRKETPHFRKEAQRSILQSLFHTLEWKKDP